VPPCFVIMPITKPAAWIPTYSDDHDHFLHLLDHLLAPAIDRAGYELLRPSSSGADLIQAEIIRKVETADLMGCNCPLGVGCRGPEAPKPHRSVPQRSPKDRTQYGNTSG
jgi:hypothetical protein